VPKRIYIKNVLLNDIINGNVVLEDDAVPFAVIPDVSGSIKILFYITE